MKTLVYGMQSSGASFVTWTLAQAPGTIAVIDLFCREEAPSLDEEAAKYNVIVKCVVNTKIPLERQIELFRPDRLLLVTRNIDDLRTSLSSKPYRDLGGPLAEKLAIYEDVLRRGLHQFDSVISYERVAARPSEIRRTVEQVVEYSKAHSPWCRKFHHHKWGVGGLRDTSRSTQHDGECPTGNLTVCLLNWKRPENLRRILDALARQTVRPKIFLWNNSPEPFRHEAIDWQIDSSCNLICSPRWWMAAHAETEFVASLDDDLIPADDRVFEDALQLAAGQPDDRVIGPVGCLLPPGQPYFPHRDFVCPEQDQQVDLVKGRCLIVRTQRLRRALSLHDLAAEDPHCDDIVICGALARGRRLYHWVPGLFHGRMRGLEEGEVGLYALPGHAERRDAARRRWLVGTPPARTD